MAKKQFLFSVQKLETGTLNIQSSSIINEEQANKLLHIFHYYSGRLSDFTTYFDEFSTQKIPLSHFSYSSKQLNPLEINILKKFNLLQTGAITPTYILEEFEALMGELIIDEDTGEYILNIEEFNDEEYIEDDYAEIDENSEGRDIII
ncbi:MAG: hypothetical protein COB02_07810 [Candidatus Cloacimonadota bacterium]|nr:MAG: hypothetical protein COB02_07810 [Candidatus Cloacimonadota bacterium]